MPANTVYVGRPGRWGNPFGIVKDQQGWAITLNDHPYYHISSIRRAYSLARPTYKHYTTRLQAIQASIEAYQYLLGLHPEQRKGPMSMEYVATMSDLHELHGKHLACWCPLSQPCHADVLLEWAQGA